MRLFHLTLTVRGRLVLARAEAERRRMVRGIARVGRGRLLLFCLVDEHLHTVLNGPRIGYLGRDIRRLLARLHPGLEITSPHVQPVESRAHLRRLVDYVLRQPSKHGLSEPPALWAGSCFLDLAGARLRLEQELKRLDRFEAVILDDIGYVQQDREEMEVLFTFFAARYERRSVLVTSNLVFSQWERIFKDPMTTAAAIDRLVHHSVILELVGPSVRAEEARKRGASVKSANAAKKKAAKKKVAKKKVAKKKVAKGRSKRTNSTSRKSVK